MILPITIPLILSLSMMESILNNPDGVLAFWMSIFPLVRYRYDGETSLWRRRGLGNYIINNYFDN